MKALVGEPRLGPLLRLGVWVSERTVGRRLMPARLLGWYPRAAVSSAVLEALVAHKEGRLDGRVLQLVRVTVSLTANCPFCVDMNGAEPERNRIDDRQFEALRVLATGRQPDWPPEMSDLEQICVRYAYALTVAPVQPAELADEVAALLTPREVVVLTTTIAQVNYWTRLIAGLGIPPAGFSDSCSVADR